MENIKAPIIGINRLRMGTDGRGVTTLVAFHGCPLNCRYCLNPHCLRADARMARMTPQQVMRILRKDELYYIATGGGVTFGGGEPLLQSGFIQKVLELGARNWHVTVETSLNVPLENLMALSPYIHEYVVDIKDMNPRTYLSYTGRDNRQVISNLEWLVKSGLADRVICRIPEIPLYNTPKDQASSKNRLEAMGLGRFNLFKYITQTNNQENGRKREMRVAEKPQKENRPSERHRL